MQSRLKTIVISMVITCLVSGVAASAEETAESAEITRFIETTLEELPVVPGMTVTVVRDGELIYLHAFGYADLENEVPMTVDTGMYIASSTKSFVGLLAARLANEGALDLDAPVSRYLPHAEVPPPLSLDEITVRDLLTHQSGLDNRAIVIRTAYLGNADQDDVVDLLRYTRPGRQGFSYTNLGYVMASVIIDRVTGSKWQSLLDRKIFEPLGMDRTTAFVSEASEFPVAVPTILGEEREIEPIPMLKSDRTMHAAGGIITTARDLVPWLEAQLGGGRVEGEQIFPESVIDEAHRKQVEVDRDFGPFHRNGYALGWYHADYEGENVMHHFGGYEGWRSHVSFMPDHGIGVAILTNTSGLGFYVPDLVATWIYDRLLGKENLDETYLAREIELRRMMIQRQVRLRNDLEGRKGRPTKFTRPAEAFVGHYTNPVLGDAEIAVADGKLVVRIGERSSLMVPYDDEDSARVEIVPGEGEVLKFDFPDDGSARGFTVPSIGLRWARIRTILGATSDEGMERRFSTENQGGGI